MPALKIIALIVIGLTSIVAIPFSISILSLWRMQRLKKWSVESRVTVLIVIMIIQAICLHIIL